MTTSDFEILSGRTAMQLGAKVAKRIKEGWQLHGNTWSTGQDRDLEFHQSVIKKPKYLRDRGQTWWQT